MENKVITDAIEQLDKLKSDLHNDLRLIEEELNLNFGKLIKQTNEYEKD